MTARTYINDNGVWRTVRAIYVNDGTAWRTVKSQWVNDNGSWRLVHRGVFVYDETISSPAANYNLRTKLTNAGWDGTQDVEANITISPGITVYSTSTPVAAFTISPALPADSTVNIINNGVIAGKGGSGGKGAGIPAPVNGSSAQGLNGGVGIFLSSNATINNTNGIIAGGGGGGGGGGSAGIVTTNYINSGGSYRAAALAGGSGGSSGGGSSISPTAGGAGGVAQYVQTPFPPPYPSPATTTPLYAITTGNGTAGNAGTDTGGAQVPGVTVTQPAVPQIGGSATVLSGAGGSGGNRGSNGGTGGTGTVPKAFPPWPPELSRATFNTVGSAGGLSGYSVQGDPYLTLPQPQQGTILGQRI